MDSELAWHTVSWVFKTKATDSNGGCSRGLGRILDLKNKIKVKALSAGFMSTEDFQNKTSHTHLDSLFQRRPLKDTVAPSLYTWAHTVPSVCFLLFQLFILFLVKFIYINVNQQCSLAPSYMWSNTTQRSSISFSSAPGCPSSDAAQHLKL